MHGQIRYLFHERGHYGPLLFSSYSSQKDKKQAAIRFHVHLMFNMYTTVWKTWRICNWW